MDALHDFRVAWKIETEKSFGAKSEIGPEISGRKQGRGRMRRAAVILQVRRRRNVRWREEAVEYIGGDIWKRCGRRSTERRVRGMLEASGDNFDWRNV